jgi:hypothetical protein
METQSELTALAEIEVPLEAVTVPLVGVPGATRSGIMVFGNVLIGGSGGDVQVKANLTPPVFFQVPRPHVIQLQARQGDNNVFGFPDQFALMVIETAIDFIRFRIRRVDAPGSGWGQNLMIDVLVIDDGVEPLVFS